ncbi:MAG: sigma-70 family RNA polymerase sigma factor [Lentimicrobiaceae bacterium]|nr:sigma-70 family RNA polymerase sigma factor [Lentimicrobiaceae bacterium]
MIKGCVNRNRRCWALLYKAYAPSLYAVALRYAKNKEDAQDILHDAFMLIFNNIKQYEGKGNFSAWTRKIVINQAMALHKRRSKMILEDYENYEETIADESIVVSDDLTHEILLNFIRELPQGLQTVFNLCVIDGYSYDEVAQKLNCSQSNCRVQLLRARNLLKEKVTDFMKRENIVGYEDI